MQAIPHFEPIRIGNLAVRIAESAEEIIAAQKLRYQVFCGEMGAKPTPEMEAAKMDFDKFDPVCDHLLVLHYPEGEEKPEVVGTYRLLRAETMPQIGRYYSEDEYDVSQLKSYPGKIMELGRSCVREDFRSRAAMQLLWRGIGGYVQVHDVALMFGCASFPGDDPEKHIEGLSYLWHFHRADPEFCARALESRYVSMDLMPPDKIDQKRAFLNLPVLVKGYLRLGGKIGDGAVLDHEYNTTDVSVVVRTDFVSEKYASKYTPGKNA